MANRVNRRQFLRTVGLGSAGLALTTRVQAVPVRKPNLIVFLPDQQRADTIGCYGGSSEIAPNLSKLATQSFVFDNCYVTNPLCTPSRSALLTGTWPHANGCTHNNVSLENQFRCLPELIDDRDYSCAYMGKWHLGDELTAQHGFSEWVSIMDGHQNHAAGERRTITACDYDRFLLSKGLAPDLTANGVFSRGFGAKLPLELSKPKFLEINASNFLEQHRRDPFVLFVAFYEPHPPYTGPLNDEHSLDQIQPAATSDHIFGTDMPLRYRLRQEWDRERYGGDIGRHLRIKQRYLGLVSEIDQAIGGILTKVEQLGLTDNTIVVHTSDHGDLLGAHRIFGKEISFQEAIRVPYLVRLPGQSKMVRVSEQVSQIDFAPTVMDLLGKPHDPQFAGTSQAGVFRGDKLAAKTVFIERSPVRRAKVKKHTRLASVADVKLAVSESTRAAISPDGWKLCLRDTDKNELYNLRTDPLERQNLFANRDLRPIISRLTGEIHQWQEKTNDRIKLSLAS
jgi:arylsulfatase A-like enzyme